MSQSDHTRPTALITGASSGLGAGYARRLAEQGYDLVLVARRRDRLESLAGELRSANGARSEVLAADLVEPEGFAAVRARAGRGDLEVLINNAGFAGYRPFVELDPELADDLVRLHVRVPTLLTRAALPHMVRRRSGAVIKLASLLAVSGTIPANPMPYRAVYAGGEGIPADLHPGTGGRVEGQRCPAAGTASRGGRHRISRSAQHRSRSARIHGDEAR
jgi:short-subunit dehydrogenase